MNRYSYNDISYFFKTREQFGVLSNFYPLVLKLANEVDIPTSEHLYQMLRFQNDLELQREILNTTNPFLMKRKVYSNSDKFIPDWKSYSLDIMYFTVALKLYLNYENIKPLLDTTKDVIVELSYRDDFWGAKPIINRGYLEGENKLGLIWTELKNKTKIELYQFLKTPNPNLKNIKLLDVPLHDIIL